SFSADRDERVDAAMTHLRDRSGFLKNRRSSCLCTNALPTFQLLTPLQRVHRIRLELPRRPPLSYSVPRSRHEEIMSFGGDEGAEVGYNTAHGRDWPSVRQFNVFLE